MNCAGQWLHATALAKSGERGKPRVCWHPAFAIRPSKSFFAQLRKNFAGQPAKLHRSPSEHVTTLGIANVGLAVRSSKDWDDAAVVRPTSGVTVCAALRNKKKTAEKLALTPRPVFLRPHYSTPWHGPGRAGASINSAREGVLL
jgi:hypothetical protein